MRTECTAPSVAKDILLAESAEAFNWTGDGDLGPGFTLTQRSWFEPPRTTAEIRRFRFDQVILDASWGVLFHDGHPIRESKYLIFDEQYEDVQIVRENVVRLLGDRTFVLGRNNGYSNYYHWLIQCLPAIEAGVHGADSGSVTIGLPELSGWQQRTLELLGFGSIARLPLEPGRQYQFPRLEFSEYLNGSSSFEISRLARDLFLRMSQAVIGPPNVRSEVVYIARTDSKQRVALNEPELIEQLHNRGVHIVIPGKLSIDEQIRTFRHARLIIAPHGAGLANVVFCTEGASLYEFFPGHYVNPCMHRLALACGLNYFADCFAANPDTDEWVHSKSWSIDILRVLDRLGGIRSHKSKPMVGCHGRSPSLQDIMMDFESLGDNCEFSRIPSLAG
jgi:Glycosyltransferase 61